MKIIFVILLLISTHTLFAQSASSEQIEQWIFESIEEMPTAGGYELTSRPVKKLKEAFTWNLDALNLDASITTPSYCTSATYLVFYKVLEKYWAWSGTNTSVAALSVLKPNLEADGLRAWGRWNSNGPGTSKFFYDAQLGRNFSDIDEARPGDFLKIFWNGYIGKREKGHSVIYLGQETIKGVPMIKFWSSSLSTDGYGVKSVPKSDAIRVIFSRLEFPENISNVSDIPEMDSFLSSMLTKDSSWEEVRRVSGF